jgi:hypothetical protein
VNRLISAALGISSIPTVSMTPHGLVRGVQAISMTKEQMAETVWWSIRQWVEMYANENCIGGACVDLEPTRATFDDGRPLSRSGCSFII